MATLRSLCDVQTGCSRHGSSGGSGPCQVITRMMMQSPLFFILLSYSCSLLFVIVLGACKFRSRASFMSECHPCSFLKMSLNEAQNRMIVLHTPCWWTLWRHALPYISVTLLHLFISSCFLVDNCDYYCCCKHTL